MKEERLSRFGPTSLALLVVLALVVVSCAPAPVPTQAPEPTAVSGSEAAPTEEAPPTQAPEEAVDQTLILALDIPVSGLDPAVIYDLTMRQTALMYEGLVALKSGTAEIVPSLATSWDISPDGMTYAFHLREGVKFHDGTTLTAEAVKKSFDRFMEIGKTTAWLFKDVLAETNVVDDLTVEFKLSRPYAAFLGLLTSVAGPMVISPTALDENWGDDMAQGWLFDHAAGTGPYKLESWDPGQQTISLVKHDDYWKGWEGERIEKIVSRYVVETTTRKLMLENGEVDIVYDLNPDETESLQGVPGVTVAEEPTMRIFVVFLNNQVGPLQDVKVRQAMAYALDYEGIRKYVYNDKLAPLCGPLPPTDPNSYPCDKVPYKLDMEKAKELLAEAGYPDGGFTLEASVMEGDFAFRKTAEILQAQLAELGIKVNITEVAWTSQWELISSLDTAPDLIPMRNYPDFADSSSIFANQYASAAWGANGWNLSYYKNERFDELLEAVTETTDEKARYDMFQEMAQLTVDDMANIFVGTLINQVSMRDNVIGYKMNPVYIPLLNAWEMHKE
ncbi:ABC transporter substrate-binding protein [Chloroflexota bacterium]